MVRTIISLAEDDKDWLLEQAKHDHISMAEVIRKAIHEYRRTKKTKPSIDELLTKTSNTWTQGDGLTYQKKLRDEWEK